MRQLQSVTEERNDYRTDVNALRETLQQERSSWENVIRENTDLKERVNIQGTTIESQKEESAKQKKQMLALQKQDLDRQHDAKAEKEHLKKELAKSNRDKVHFQKQLSEMEAKERTAAAANLELKSKCSRHEEEVKKSKEQSSLDVQKVLEKSKEELALKEERINLLVAENNKLVGEYKELQEVTANEKDALNKEKNSLTDKVEGKEKALKEIIQKYQAESKQQSEEVKTAVQKATKERENTTSAERELLQKMQIELSKCQKELKQANLYKEAALKDKEKATEKREEYNEALKEAFALEKATKEEHSQEVKTLTNKIKEHEEKIKDLELSKVALKQVSKTRKKERSENDENNDQILTGVERNAVDSVHQGYN